MVEYLHNVESVEPAQLRGFFEGWPQPPSPEVHLRILQRADEVVVARDSDTGTVVGFVTALTDGVLTAYLPLLEVLPRFRRQGIGRELVRRILERLSDLYMVDLLCDAELQSFYASLGMRPATGMSIRRFEFQSGALPKGTA